MWITAHLPAPKGWKADQAWLVDPQWTIYRQTGHISTVDQALTAVTLYVTGKVGQPNMAMDGRWDVS